jgi:hypothetical protein
MHKNENTQNSHSFLALAFFKVIFLPISIILRLIPITFETLKPPNAHIYRYSTDFKFCMSDSTELYMFIAVLRIRIRDPVPF